MELHTFSSLNQEFLNQYKDSMNMADEAIVYFNPHTLEHKKLSPITAEQVQTAFNQKGIFVFTKAQEIRDRIGGTDLKGKTVLFMSSGNFGGLDLQLLAAEALK